MVAHFLNKPFRSKLGFFEKKFEGLYNADKVNHKKVSSKTHF